MATFSMQKQSLRNLLLSANTQAAYGGTLADNKFSVRQRFDPASVFTPNRTNRTDQMAAGKGSEWATNQQTTAWDTSGTLQVEADAFAVGWMLSLIFGVETVTGAGPYRHDFTTPAVSATMPCTTIYIEETEDVHYKLPDMAVSAVTFSVPERGSVSASADLVGTGRWVDGTFGGSLPGLIPANYLLGNDMSVTITPSGGGATSYNGRIKGLSIKFDRQAKPFESAGDGLYSGSVASGWGQFEVDFTIAANATDDVNGWFEDQISLDVEIATNPAMPYRFGFSFPAAYIKANKLTNTEDKVMWSLTFDQTTCLQIGAQPAISAFVINDTPAFLEPA